MYLLLCKLKNAKRKKRLAFLNDVNRLYGAFDDNIRSVLSKQFHKAFIFPAVLNRIPRFKNTAIIHRAWYSGMFGGKHIECHCVSRPKALSKLQIRYTRYAFPRYKQFFLPVQSKQIYPRFVDVFNSGEQLNPEISNNNCDSAQPQKCVKNSNYRRILYMSIAVRKSLQYKQHYRGYRNPYYCSYNKIFCPTLHIIQRPL